MAALWNADSGLRNLMDQFDSDSGCHLPRNRVVYLLRA